MRKLCLILVVVLLFSSIIYGATTATGKTLTLTFDGTTAQCTTKITHSGAYIDVTMKLYKGTTFVQSWHKSGLDIVKLEKTKICISGQTYTLQADVTVDGVPVNVSPMTEICP